VILFDRLQSLRQVRERSRARATACNILRQALREQDASSWRERFDPAGVDSLHHSGPMERHFDIRRALLARNEESPGRTGLSNSRGACHVPIKYALITADPITVINTLVRR
jgi:hypothetical protein